jgi:FeS assembly SUF system regulator
LFKINKLTDYAAIVALSLSDYPRVSCSAAEVSQRTGIAYPTVSKVLKLLLESGLVTSHRGVRGGYVLARSLDQISLAQLVEAIEGGLSVTSCCTDTGECMRVESCGTKNNWQLVNRSLNVLFQSISLQDMSGTMTLSSVTEKFMKRVSAQQNKHEERL